MPKPVLVTVAVAVLLSPPPAKAMLKSPVTVAVLLSPPPAKAMLKVPVAVAVLWLPPVAVAVLPSPVAVAVQPVQFVASAVLLAPVALAVEPFAWVGGRVRGTFLYLCRHRLVEMLMILSVALTVPRLGRCRPWRRGQPYPDAQGDR